MTRFLRLDDETLVAWGAIKAVEYDHAQAAQDADEDGQPRKAQPARIRIVTDAMETGGWREDGLDAHLSPRTYMLYGDAATELWMVLNKTNAVQAVGLKLEEA